MPQPGRIYQKGIENSKNYSSGASQFTYGSKLSNKQQQTTAASLGQQFPEHMANKRIGRFSSSPLAFATQLNAKRDELLGHFNKDHQMEYLKSQVRRMESPDGMPRPPATSDQPEQQIPEPPSPQRS